MVSVGQIGNRAKAVFTIVTRRRIQHHVAAGESRFHFAHFFRLHVELAGHDAHFRIGKHLTVSVAIQRFRTEALLA